jgi:tetratricopeptide (TPR) repeat protein
MMKLRIGAMLMGLLTVAPAAVTAQDGVANRVSGAQDTRLVQPECKLDGGDFRVSSGKTYLKSGIEGSRDQSIQNGALKNGVRVVMEAITSAGQGKSSAAWYWLARLYLQQGDLVGADTAFTAAQTLAPGCKEDIMKYRYRTWAALVNAAIAFRQTQQNDSALILYRAANQISREGPVSFSNMADLFDNMNQPDSSIYYYGLAAQTEPTDANQIKLRDQAIYNYGVLLLKGGRPAEAVNTLRHYVALHPEDIGGKKAIAQAFRAAGMADSAAALERQMVAGVGAGAGGGDEELSDGDLFNFATRLYGDKNYADASVSYGKLLLRNPNHRNALYAQANSYLALKDGAGLVGAAQKLVALEPLSDYDLQLLAQGYKFTKQQDKALETVIAEYALPVDLQFERFDAKADEATFNAKAVGRETRDPNNKLLPPRAVSITLEFLGKDGSVLASQDATISALSVGESAPVQVSAKATGVRAWRYRVN